MSEILINFGLKILKKLFKLDYINFLYVKHVFELTLKQ